MLKTISKKVSKIWQQGALSEGGNSDEAPCGELDEYVAALASNSRAAVSAITCQSRGWHINFRSESRVSESRPQTLPISVPSFYPVREICDTLYALHSFQLLRLSYCTTIHEQR